MDFSKEEKKILQMGIIRRLSNDTRLNEWEREFLSSVSKSIQRSDLTPKQESMLENIRAKYEKVV